MIPGGLDHPPPVQKRNLPVARHAPIKAKVLCFSKPVGNMVVQNTTAGPHQLCRQIMFPPQGVGINGEADVMAFIQLVENVERLAKAGNQRPEAAHHGMKRFEGEPDPMPARQRGRGVETLDDHAPYLFDIEAGLPGQRQILEAAGDQN